MGQSVARGAKASSRGPSGNRLDTSAGAPATARSIKITEIGWRFVIFLIKRSFVIYLVTK